jgi:hypothetical protein
MIKLHRTRVAIFIVLAAIFLTAELSRAACTHYASPNGGGNGLSASSPFRVSDFWQVASPGKTLCLLDGTYRGDASMLRPTTGLSGVSGNPITVQALNDGAVLFDGEFARAPCALWSSSYFVLQGFNCAHGGPLNTEEALSVNGAGNNILRRIGAWDSYDSGRRTPTTPNLSNNSVVVINGSSNNLLEDCFAFGAGRYIFIVISFKAHANGNIFRRVWGRFDEQLSLFSHPRAVILPNYTGTETTLVESSIFEWASSSATRYGVVGPYLTLSGGFNYDRPGDTLRMYGNLFFIGSKLQNFHSGSSVIPGWPGDNAKQLQENTVLIHPNNRTFGTALSLYATPLAPNTTLVKDHLLIGGLPNIINTNWNTSNLQQYSEVSQVADPYKYLRSLWVNGTKTTQPLWPWPMRQRILDATRASGWPVADVHQDVTNVLGGLPSSGVDTVAPIVIVTSPANGAVIPR